MKAKTNFKKCARLGFAAAVAVSGIALGNGCQSPNTRGMAVQADIADGQMSTAIVATDPALMSNISVTAIYATVTDSEFLRAQAEVVNLGKRDFAAQYKFHWYDAAGMEMAPDKRPWEPLVIHGGEAKRLQAVAPYPGAASLKVQFRKM